MLLFCKLSFLFVLAMQLEKTVKAFFKAAPILRINPDFGGNLFRDVRKSCLVLSCILVHINARKISRYKLKKACLYTLEISTGLHNCRVRAHRRKMGLDPSENSCLGGRGDLKMVGIDAILESISLDFHSRVNSRA